MRMLENTPKVLIPGKGIEALMPNAMPVVKDVKNIGIEAFR